MFAKKPDIYHPFLRFLISKSLFPKNHFNWCFEHPQLNFHYQNTDHLLFVFENSHPTRVLNRHYPWSTKLDLVQFLCFFSKNTRIFLQRIHVIQKRSPWPDIICLNFGFVGVFKKEQARVKMSFSNWKAQLNCGIRGCVRNVGHKCVWEVWNSVFGYSLV